MSDEDSFNELYDSMLQMSLVDIIKKQKIKSVKDIEVYRRKVKKKFLKFFWRTDSVQVIKYIVDEPEFVMETLLDNLVLRQLADVYVRDYEVEIIDLQGNLVI